jgi:hypothetical protein
VSALTLKRIDLPPPAGGRSRPDDSEQDARLFGFELPEEGWMDQFSQLCAADELDENGVVRWRAWLDSRPPGLSNARDGDDPR